MSLFPRRPIAALPTRQPPRARALTPGRDMNLVGTPGSAAVQRRVALSPSYLEAHLTQDLLDLVDRHPRYPVARLLVLDRQPQPHGRLRGIRTRRLIHRDCVACDPRHLAQPDHGVFQVVKPIVDEDEVETAVSEGQPLHIGHQGINGTLNRLPRSAARLAAPREMSALTTGLAPCL